MFKYSLLYLILLSIESLYAVNTTRFKSYTVEDGISDNYITFSYVDSRGFIWLGSQDGLNRYDGYNYKIYRYDEKDSNSLQSNFVYCIFEDSDSILWIGCNNGGLAQYNREKDNFTTFLFDSIHKKTIGNNSVRGIIEDNEGFLWIATNIGVNRFDKKTRTFKKYSTQQYGVNGPSTCLLQDSYSNIWIGQQSDDKTLLLYDKTNDRFISFNTLIENKNIRFKTVKSMYEDQDQRLWIGTEKNGLILFDREKRKFYNYLPDSLYSSNTNYIKSIFEDDNFNLWIGTLDGLFTFDREKKKFTPYRNSPYDCRSISNNSINHITSDHSGNIWIATNGGGVNCMLASYNNFIHYQHLPKEKNGLPNNEPTCFYEDSDGKLWIGFDNGGGLSLLNRKTNSFTHFKMQNAGLISNSILKIIPDFNENLWLATWGGGVILFDRKKHTVIKEFSNNKGEIEPYPNVKGLWINPKDSILWVATHGKGLQFIDTRTNTYIKPQSIKNFDVSIPIWGNQIIRDKYNNIWIATNDGLFRYDGSLHSYNFDVNDHCSIPSNRINHIFIDSRDQIWIGTEAGICQYNYSDNSFNRIYQNLIPNNIKSIIEDYKGSIWISTNKGICVIGKDNSVKNYDKNSGLQGNQFIERSIYRTKDGEIILGGINGCNIFSPHTIFLNKHVPEIAFTNFKIFNEEVKVGEGSVLGKNITETSEIIIDYSQSIVSFEFSALDFTDPSKNKYSFYLEGFENTWCKPTSKREVTYTNLDPGEYIFRVKACNNDDLWNNEGLTVSLIVIPPWWLRWWFKILLFIIISSLFVGFYIIRTRAMFKQQLILEEKVSMRTQELKTLNITLEEKQEEVLKQNEMLNDHKMRLEHFNKQALKRNEEILAHQEKILEQNQMLENRNMQLDELNRTKNRFLSIIAHDLKNPINTLIGFSDLLRNNFNKFTDEKKYNYIEKINTSSNHIFNLLNNLLSWARSQSDLIKVDKELFDIKDLIIENVGFEKDNAEVKKIKIDIEQIINQSVFADKNMVSTIIRNLLSNAIKFTPYNGKIHISTERYSSTKLKINIKDSGIGMTQEKVDKLFSIEYSSSTRDTENKIGTGLGLLVCKEFIEKNNGKIFIESKLEKGSTFSFTIPLINEV